MGRRNGLRPPEVRNRTIFLALEVQTLGRNLSEMNFHS